MFSLDSLFLFVFIFSSLVLLRTLITFVSSLVQNPPKRLFYNSGELIFLGLAVSYIITFLIKL